MTKRCKQAIIIMGTVLVVFSVVVFVIPFRKGGTFWIAYTAELLAIALQIPVFKLAYDKANDLKSKVLGFPIFRVGYIYLTVQSIVSILLFVVGTVFKSIPIWIPLVLCIIIITVAFICSIAVDIAREEVEKIEYLQKVDTAFIKSMRVRSKNLVTKTNSMDIQRLLEKLSDDFRFSDPVSSEHTKEIESNIANKMTLLENSVTHGENIDELYTNISELLNDRNNVCKMYKHY